MFIEHLRTLIYRSLWSEMLDDRKFYFPISSGEPDAPPQQEGGPFRNMQLRKWRPLGPDESVAMDKDHPFVGDQSPKVELDASTPRGIRQSGLALVKGKKYTGRVYLRGTPGSKVTVSLIWGERENDRQTISFTALTYDYKKFPLNFTSPADTDAASLEITGTGAGNFHTGSVSLMPVDNTQGFRPETIALLRQLHSGFWRLPGGNFISDWNWYDSVGNIDKRPPVFDYAWNAMQTNDVGMDELMTFCKLIGTEPYITVNAGFGDAYSAAEQVHERIGRYAAGRPERTQRPPRALSRKVLGYWQRALRELAARPHRFEVLRPQTQ
jgi:alpha-N-arabinofuranosidase